jgi:prepilin-type N-terminal cleavage/methylation domain-containing protein
MDTRFDDRSPGGEGASARWVTTPRRLRPNRSRCGFSLTELLVVLAVSAILASLLFPAFRGVRESAQRMACASNMRQIGLAITMYSDANDRFLPRSPFAEPPTVGNFGARDLVNANLGEHRSFFGDPAPEASWSGLAWLLSGIPGGGGYLGAPSVLYSPSYRGLHTYERYKDHYVFPGPAPIVTNYHYCGHVNFGTPMLRRMTGGHDEVLVATGMRLASEMNQRDGTNVLRGDCAVTWHADPERRLHARVRSIEGMSPIEQAVEFREIWKLLAKPKN